MPLTYETLQAKFLLIFANDSARAYPIPDATYAEAEAVEMMEGDNAALVSRFKADAPAKASASALLAAFDSPDAYHAFLFAPDGPLFPALDEANVKRAYQAHYARSHAAFANRTPVLYAPPQDAGGKQVYNTLQARIQAHEREIGTDLVLTEDNSEEWANAVVQRGLDGLWYPQGDAQENAELLPDTATQDAQAHYDSTVLRFLPFAIGMECDQELCELLNKPWDGENDPTPTELRDLFRARYHAKQR